MQKFTLLHGVAAPMMFDNIDTDAITPSAAGRSTSSDLGAMLFNNARYHLDGSENPEFVFNQAKFRHSSILVTGKNFGCGSSRERAVWALMAFGIRCVVAPSFADIFYDNSLQNGLLPVVLPDAECEALAAQLEKNEEPIITVDLIQRQVTFPDQSKHSFAISGEQRSALLEGLDEISVILKYETRISRFEQEDMKSRPWIYADIGTGRLEQQS